MADYSYQMGLAKSQVLWGLRAPQWWLPEPMRRGGVIAVCSCQSGLCKSVQTGGGPDTTLSVWVGEPQEVTVETLAFQSGLFLRYPHMIDSQRAAGRESAVLCGAVTLTDPTVVEARRSGTRGVSRPARCG